MSYRIEEDEHVGPAARRIAREQVEKALAEIRDPELPVDERVHQLRKRCKKIRAVARLIRPGFGGYKSANRLFRDIAREVSEHRDARVMAELVDDLYEAGDEESAEGSEPERWFWLRCELAEQHADAVLAKLEERLAAAALAVEKWDVAGITPEDAIAGMTKTLGRAHDCYGELGQYPDSPPVRKYHEWRKRTKYHRLHTRLAGHFLPETDKARRKRFKKVDSVVGDAHDCSVLLETLASTPVYLRERPDVQELAAEAMQRRRKLRRDALNVADGLFIEDPEDFANRLRENWIGDGD